MATIGKNVYIDVLDDIVKKYNNTVHSSIKMKTKDVTDDSFVEDFEEVIKKSPKFKVGHNIRILKYKNVFAKSYTPNCFEKVFIVNKVQNTFPWTYLINDLNGAEIKGSFYEKELQKTNQKEFKIEKVIKKKGDKLYLKWKGYDNSFDSLINKKEFIQKEFKSLTKANTSDFALKVNVAEIKKVDDIDVDKINSIDELQGKNYVEDSFLYFKLEQRYLETPKFTKTNVFSWKSVGLSDEKIKFSGESYFPTLPFDKEKIYITFNSDILA